MKFSELFDSSELPQIKGSEADTILKLFHAGIAPSGQTETAFFRALGLHSAQNNMASADQLGMFNNFRMMVSPDAVRLAERQENARAAYDLLTRMSLQGELRGPVNPATIGPPPQQLANPGEQFSMAGGGQPVGGQAFNPLPGMTGPMGPSGGPPGLGINPMTNRPPGQAPVMPGPGVSLVPQPGIVGTYGNQPIDAAQRAFLLDPRGGATMKEQAALQIPAPSVYERVAGAQLRTQENIEARRELQQKAQGFTAEQKDLDRDIHLADLEERKHRNALLAEQRKNATEDRREQIIRSQFKSDRHSDIVTTGNAGILIPDGTGGYIPDIGNIGVKAANTEKLRQAYAGRLTNARRRGARLESQMWQDELATLPAATTPTSITPALTTPGKVGGDDFPNAPRGKAIGALLRDQSGKLIATWGGSGWIKVPPGTK